MFRRLLPVFGVPAPEQQRAVHFRVQRLHASAQHLRPAREIGNVAHRDSCFTQQLGGPARRENLDLPRGQPLRKFQNSCLVKNTDERALYRHKFLHKEKSRTV